MFASLSVIAASGGRDSEGAWRFQPNPAGEHSWPQYSPPRRFLALWRSK
jgi:hypothetical protein